MISRLRKNITADNSIVLCPNMILFKDSWNWVENDPFTKTKYNTGIDRTWEFESMKDNSEWELLKS